MQTLCVLMNEFLIENFRYDYASNIKSKWWTAKQTKLIASSGNRTRAARVAGEHSTTEPTMLSCCFQGILSIHIWQNRRQQQEKIRGR